MNRPLRQSPYPRRASVGQADGTAAALAEAMKRHGLPLSEDQLPKLRRALSAWLRQYGVVHISSNGSRFRCNQPKLSARQLDVLNGLSTGLTEKEIAWHLKISRHTVHEHVKAIYRRLGISSRVQLMSQFIHGSPSNGVNGSATARRNGRADV